MPKADYRIVREEHVLAEIETAIRKAPLTALDLETSSFNWRTGVIAGWGLSVAEKQAWYIPVTHFGEQCIYPEAVVEALGPALTAGQTTIYNAKFDTRFLREAGVHLAPTKIRDALLEVYASGEGWTDLDLKSMVEALFQHKMVHFDDLFPPRTKVKDIRTVPGDVAGPYGCEDADYLLRVHHYAEPKVAGTFIDQLEHELWPVVQEIEENGVEADAEYMLRLAAYIRRRAAEVWTIVLAQAEHMAGRPVVVRATDAGIRELLFDVLHLPVKVETTTGKAGTGKVALELLAEEYPICRNILTYRSMISTARTEGEELPGHIDPFDRSIHTSYRQTGVPAGRFASSKPNMQNQGKEKTWHVALLDGTEQELEVKPREAFVAREGYYLAELDFTAIEFVLLAAKAGEQAVVDAYVRGDDVHVQTAADILRIPPAEVDKYQRGKAKTLNYLLIYGGGAQGMSRRTKQTEEEAERDLKAFFRARPHFQSYINRVRERARVQKHVLTHFGRKVCIPQYDNPGNRRQMAAGDRYSVNAVVQGTAADIQKAGLIRTQRKIRKLWSREQARCILQTHDSQAWEIHRSIRPQDIIPELIKAMSPQATGLPRVKVDANVGISYGRLVEYNPETDYAPVWEQLAAAREAALLALGDPTDDVPAGIEIVECEEPVELVAKPGLTLRLTADPADPQVFLAGLYGLLEGFPGTNVVQLTLGSRAPVDLAKRPTGLTEADLRLAVQPLCPGAQVATERAALVAAVAAGLA